MTLTLTDIVRLVSDQVAKTQKRKVIVEADTALFEEGLVDSFALADLIVALEKAGAGDLSEGALLPDDFASPRVLFARLQELG